MATEDFDHLVYVRIFEGCNLACEHCFIPANPKKMTEQQLLNLPSEFTRFAKPGQKILIQWHGGEPTMLGPDILRDSMAHWIKAYPEYRFSFGIQTNLMTYNEDWKQLYLDYFNGHIGVSWDAKIRLMRKGKKESNAEFEEKFWSNLNQLVSDGISPYLVVTGTKIFFEMFKNPYDFFELMKETGIQSGHIERLTKTGVAREHWGEIGCTNAEHSHYMLKFARAYFSYLKMPHSPDSPPIHLSPFDGLKASLERLEAGEAGGSGCLSGICDTRFHTFDANGYKKGCTAVTSESDNKNSGVQVVQILDYRLARKLRQNSCTGCDFLPICSSGCLASEKWDDSGECSGGKILFKGAQKLI